jgi:TubC N-terminal docking domain
MILMLLLTELTHLDVRLTNEQGRLKVEAPPGALTEDLIHAMARHKTALLQFAAFPFVETINGLDMLTGTTQQRDLYLVAEERQEALRCLVGVVSLHDGIERFYYPRMVLLAQPEEARPHE